MATEVCDGYGVCFRSEVDLFWQYHINVGTLTICMCTISVFRRRGANLAAYVYGMRK